MAEWLPPQQDQRSWAERLMGDAGNYLRNSYDGLARIPKELPQAASEAWADYGAPAVSFAAAMLPGAGFVQGAQDARAAGDAWRQGNYARAAVSGLSSLGNTGLEALGPLGHMAMAVPPAVRKAANLPPIVRQSERDLVNQPMTRHEPFRLTGVSTAHIPQELGTWEHPYQGSAQSMTPVVGTTVRSDSTAEDVIRGLADSYDPGRALPDAVNGGDVAAFQRWLEGDPNVRALIDRRLEEARGAGIMPPEWQDDSETWLALHADRNPRAGWARYAGPDASPDRTLAMDRKEAGMVDAERAAAEAASRRDAAYEAYKAAGGTPSSPKAIAEWEAANPGRQHTRMEYDPATGGWQAVPRQRWAP